MCESWKAATSVLLMFYFWTKARWAFNSPQLSLPVCRRETEGCIFKKISSLCLLRTAEELFWPCWNGPRIPAVQTPGKCAPWQLQIQHLRSHLWLGKQWHCWQRDDRSIQCKKDSSITSASPNLSAQSSQTPYPMLSMPKYFWAVFYHHRKKLTWPRIPGGATTYLEISIWFECLTC